MRILIVYDSIYGNTKKLAEEMGKGITKEYKVFRITEITPIELQNIDLLIIGSPTHGGRPTKDIQEFIDNAKYNFNDLKVAAFDTRIQTRLVGIFGYAADRIADYLKKKGSDIIIKPTGFYVKSTKGPLKEGEVERANNWIKEIIKNI
ncbi:flavodoxin family protein [Candidatus Bathyarchaeota archaeon]|nr:flavodoxin family protein [Candidatus Bathyarchaeota archaeon]